MSSSAFPVIDQIGAALSVSSLRHEAIASNIANRDSEGYRRLHVRFTGALDAAGDVRLAPEAAPGTPPSLEQDLVALSSNALRYEALTRSLSRYFSILAVIANPNRS